MHIKDKEPWPVKQRYYDRRREWHPFVLGPLAGHTNQITWTEKAGGELRVEVYLDFVLVPTDQSVQVVYDMRFFEGATENTNDLEDQKGGSVIIKKDRPASIDVTLRNRGTGGGDRARVRFQLVNAVETNV